MKMTLFLSEHEQALMFRPLYHSVIRDRGESIENWLLPPVPSYCLKHILYQILFQQDVTFIVVWWAKIYFSFSTVSIWKYTSVLSVCVSMMGCWVIIWSLCALAWTVVWLFCVNILLLHTEFSFMSYFWCVVRRWDSWVRVWTYCSCWCRHQISARELCPPDCCCCCCCWWLPVPCLHWMI